MTAQPRLNAHLQHVMWHVAQGALEAEQRCVPQCVFERSASRWEGGLPV